MSIEKIEHEINTAQLKCRVCGASKTWSESKEQVEAREQIEPKKVLDALDASSQSARAAVRPIDFFRDGPIYCKPIDYQLANNIEKIQKNTKMFNVDKIENKKTTPHPTCVPCIECSSSSALDEFDFDAPLIPTLKPWPSMDYLESSCPICDEIPSLPSMYDDNAADLDLLPFENPDFI